MSESVYWMILLIADGLILFMGIHLIFGTINKVLQGSNYHHARQAAGAALLATPIGGIVFYCFKLIGYEQPYIATAINLTVYYLTAILVAISFLFLLGHKSDHIKRRTNYIVITGIIYIIPTWLPIMIGETKAILPCHIISNVMLGVIVISILAYIYKIYKRESKRIDNYYSEDEIRHINWVAKSIYLFALLAIIACISPFSNSYSLWFSFGYVLYQILVYGYIYESIMLFEQTTLRLSENKEPSDTEPIPTIKIPTTPINKETSQQIGTKLDKWLKNEGYLKPGITIQSVAYEIYTNRTYLSNYVNTTYKCTFRDWITQHRINKAKELLLDKRHLSAIEVAEQTGFASASSFIHTFKKTEGLPPKQWRDKNI